MTAVGRGNTVTAAAARSRARRRTAASAAAGANASVASVCALLLEPPGTNVKGAPRVESPVALQSEYTTIPSLPWINKGVWSFTAVCPLSILNMTRFSSTLVYVVVFNIIWVSSRCGWLVKGRPPPTSATLFSIQGKWCVQVKSSCPPAGACNISL